MFPRLRSRRGKPSDMAFGDSLPVSESVGVFLGVSGIDWLADGRAEPAKAIAAGIAAGVALYLLRRWLKRRRTD